jgi:amidase
MTALLVAEDHALGAAEIACRVATGEASARDVLEQHLRRIEAGNPTVNAIVTLAADTARDAADAVDRARADGLPTGRLAGVPITVKDTFATAGLRTTAGSPRLASHVPAHDATAVARLRSAGAVIVGKTNTPPLATGAETVNDLFGRTVNPWDHRRTTGGSSGGSAASVASGFTALDIGSDIGGSIRVPAHFCGVFGMKTTENLVSPIGHIPPPPGAPWGLLRMLLSVGPLARSIDDLALALSVIGGPDPARPDVPPVPLDGSVPVDVGSLRVAWWDEFGVPISSDTRGVLRATVDALTAAGASVEHAAPAAFDPPMLAALANEIQLTAVHARATPLHVPRALLRGVGGLVERHDRAAGGFLRGMGGTLSSLARAMSARDRAIEDLERFLASQDAWLVPVAPTPAFPHLAESGALGQLRARLDVDGSAVPLVLGLEACASPFNLTGNPVVVLPAGRSHEGLPIGLQLVGPRWGDMRLLGVARAVWRALGRDDDLPIATASATA